MLDPLQYGLELPSKATLFPLGFELRLEANSPLVVEAVRESWACYQQNFDTPPIELRVAIGGAADALPPTPSFRGHGHLLAIVSDQQNFAICDRTSSSAFCQLTPAVAQNPLWMRYYFLDAIVYTLLTQLYLTPIHAACVARDGKGILLCGDSGAGKSCLSYACARRGWTYLTDDAAALVRGDGEPTLLGRPHQIRFRETAASLFPELAGMPSLPSINSEPGIELRTRAVRGVKTGLRSRAGYVVFLRRPGSPVRLVPLPEDAALRRLEENLAFYGEEILEEQKRSLSDWLAADQGPRAFELHYQGLDEAVHLLEQLVDQGVRV